MIPVSGYEPVDLGSHKEFRPQQFKELCSLIIPSQGAERDDILNREGEMTYEQRQYSMGVGSKGGLFVTRRPFPKAEMSYWKSIFSSTDVLLPETMPLDFKADYLNVPLDRIITSNPKIMDKIRKRVDKLMASTDVEVTVQSFNQTSHIERIAYELGIRYFGNSDFAEWAGTKTGLIDFAQEYGVPTPPTFKVLDFANIPDQIEQLRKMGYEELVVKLDHSTGGMGHKRLSLDEAMKAVEQGYYDRIFPDQFSGSRRKYGGAILQGWVPSAISLSLAIFVDFDGTYTFTGAQIHELKKDNAFSAVGAYPVSESYLPKLLEYGHKIAQGYLKYEAYGPHTVGFIVQEKLDNGEKELYFNDENSRPGSSTISLNWILSLTEGRYGKGWRVSKVPVAKGVDIKDVLTKLDDEKLLIKKVGSDQSGVFVYNGLTLDSGYEQKFYAIALSANDDYSDADYLMDRVKELFKP